MHDPPGLDGVANTATDFLVAADEQKHLNGEGPHGENTDCKTVGSGSP